MKKIKYLTLGVAFMLGLGSCSLDTEVYDNKDGGNAYTTLKDIENGLNGAYYRVGSYYLLGNYATTIGDFCSGMSTGSASSGHMYSYSAFTITSTDQEIEDMWGVGYMTIVSATETINAAEELIANGGILESEVSSAYTYIGQLYAIKALVNYYLVNLYALPYSETNKSQLGLIIIDKEVPEAFASVSRGTIEETYAQITKDIQSAEDAFAQGDETPGRPDCPFCNRGFYDNESALFTYAHRFSIQYLYVPWFAARSDKCSWQSGHRRGAQCGGS